jgi:UDP:flavonoid glycosyltransferase YjiC (YdhE family)
MEIVIVAPGSRGDVQPYVALAKGLREAGHGVRLVTHEDFEALGAAHGVDVWPAPGSVRAVAQGQRMRQRLASGSFLAVMAAMAREAKRAALTMTRAGLAASEGADLILAGIGGLFTGLALAEKRGLPLIPAYYIPFTPTRAFPSFLLSSLPRWMGPAVNRPSHLLARQVMWQGFRAGDAVARRQVLDVPPAPLRGPFAAAALRGSPTLYGYSPSVIARPSDWGDDVHVTGYWFLDANADWAPPPALAAFLEAGPPPVYIGFGSMSSRDPAATSSLILKTLARTGQRAVLLSGWGGLQADDAPDSVFLIDSVPFSWLFLRVSGVVHHGGAGTTAAGLRAGVPTQVVPFFGDQPFWGRRVAALGAGPPPIPQRRLTVDRLAAAIERLVGDEGIRQRAAELGARIRAEDGVGQAVSLIEGFARA